MEMKTFGDLKIGDDVYVTVCGKCLFPSEHVLKVEDVRTDVKVIPKGCVYLKFNEDIDSIGRDNLVVKKSNSNWTSIILDNLYVRVSTTN